MDSKGLEKLPCLGNSSERLFDNPLASRLLTVSDIARIFQKSERWVTRMIADGSLPHHYVGETPMFDSEEVLYAFLSDSLGKRRKTHDKNKEKQERPEQVRSQRDDQRAKTLSEIRLAR